MSQKGKRQITQPEVAAALAVFLQHGGMIKKLPAEKFQSAGTVGGEKYQAYESLSDLPKLAGMPEHLN